MKKSFQLTGIFCLMLLSSCIQSLYPLTENKDQIIFKSELLGKWKESDGTQYFVDSLNEETYRLTIIYQDMKKEEKRYSDTNYFLMTLADIDGKYFLDCIPDIHHPLFYTLGEQTSNFLLPVHYILLLNSISKSSIEIASINADEVKKLINQKKININYEKVSSDAVLLTQKPGWFQQKLIELEKFPRAYQKNIFQRY